MSAAEEQLSLCRELCEDLANDLKKEGLKVEDCTLLRLYTCIGCLFVMIEKTTSKYGGAWIRNRQRSQSLPAVSHTMTRNWESIRKRTGWLGTSITRLPGSRW